MRTTILLPSGRYEVEIAESATLLDALESIRSTAKHDLRYRHSCHHGSCGSCGALVNGAPALMCLTRLGEFAGASVHVEPLKKMELIGDIAVHPGRFFDAMPDTGYLRSSDVPHRGLQPEGGSWERFEACIECGICVDACPVETPFDGPAALAAADREREERPGREAEMLDYAGNPRGVPACERKFACSRACPQGLAPGRRIEKLRRSLADRLHS